MLFAMGDLVERTRRVLERERSSVDAQVRRPKLCCPTEDKVKVRCVSFTEGLSVVAKLFGDRRKLAACETAVGQHGLIYKTGT